MIVKSNLFLKNLTKKLSNDTIRILLALVIGIGTGLGAVGFLYLIDFFEYMFFTQGSIFLTPFMGSFYVIVLPVLGGLIIGPLAYYLLKDARGYGIPDIIAAIAIKGGKINTGAATIKTLLSAICIGSGSSVGIIGPIVQIGSATGSVIGRFVNFSACSLKTMAACGAAGGIAAAFNAPIGGVMFSLEIILGEFTGNHLIMVIISAVSAAVVARFFLGDSPAFDIPAYSLNDPLEFIFYTVLGILCAVCGVLYTRSLYISDGIFSKIKLIPGPLKPAIGGLVVGCIGFYYPYVFGVGYDSIELALNNQMILATAAALILLKLLATSVALGSGGAGGMFAPCLFIGAMLGYTFGFMLHSLFPSVAVAPAAYALVAMGGLFASSAHAPLTAIMLLFEMSNDYNIILPLMVTCIISSVLAKNLYKHNMCTIKLTSRGLDIDHARRPDVLKNVLTRDVMTTDLETIPGHFTPTEAWKSVSGSSHQGFPVVNEQNILSGIITQHELEKAISKGLGDKRIDCLISSQLVVVTPDEPLSVAARKMDEYEIGRLPVVDPDNNSKLLGLLSRSDIIKAYGLGRTANGLELGESAVLDQTEQPGQNKITL